MAIDAVADVTNKNVDSAGLTAGLLASLRFKYRAIFEMHNYLKI